MKDFKAPGLVRVMGAWGVLVCLMPDEPEYFSMLVEFGGRWHWSMVIQSLSKQAF